MPIVLMEMAARAGLVGFALDVGLINRYESGARLMPHLNRRKRHFNAPNAPV
jgi:hypothetical protein